MPRSPVRNKNKIQKSSTCSFCLLCPAMVPPLEHLESSLGTRELSLLGCANYLHLRFLRNRKSWLTQGIYPRNFVFVLRAQKQHWRMLSLLSWVIAGCRWQCPVGVCITCRCTHLPGQPPHTEPRTELQPRCLAQPRAVPFCWSGNDAMCWLLQQCWLGQAGISRQGFSGPVLCADIAFMNPIISAASTWTISYSYCNMIIKSINQKQEIHN